MLLKHRLLGSLHDGEIAVQPVPVTGVPDGAQPRSARSPVHSPAPLSTAAPAGTGEQVASRVHHDNPVAQRRAVAAIEGAASGAYG